MFLRTVRATRRHSSLRLLRKYESGLSSVANGANVTIRGLGIFLFGTTVQFSKNRSIKFDREECRWIDSTNQNSTNYASDTVRYVATISVSKN